MGEAEAGKSEDMGIAWRGGCKGNLGAPSKYLWVPYCMTGPSPAASTIQLGYSFPRERLHDGGEMEDGGR